MSNQDIYKLVEEMNKNKQKKEVDDIFSMLNEVQEKNNISVEDVRNSVNRSSDINLNTNLNTFTDSNLSALTTAYEQYYTVTNPSATLNEKMNFVIDYLRTNGYLK